MPTHALVLWVRGEFQFGSSIPYIRILLGTARPDQRITRTASVTYWRKEDDPLTEAQILDRFIVTCRDVGFFFPDGSVGALVEVYDADVEIVRMTRDNAIAPESGGL